MKKLFLFFLIVPVMMQAQPGRQSIQWRSIVSAGVISGEAGNDLLLQLSGGLKIKKFFAGAGAGFDGYRFHSYPLFIDLRFSPGKNQQLFFYGLGGYHFAKKHDITEEWLKKSDRLKGGFYADAGLGYFMPAGKRNRFALSAGVTYKYLTQIKTFENFCTTGDCGENIFKLRHRLGRLTAKLSWEFGY